MRKTHCLFICILIFLAGAVAAWAQESGADKVIVPLSDPARPALIRVSLIAGGIAVRGYDGKEVIIEAIARSVDSESRRREGRWKSGREAEQTQGMKRILNTSTGLRASEDNNVVEVSTSSFGRSVDLTLQVPRKTNLKLHTINSGDIKAENVQGEIEAEDINGTVTLTNISGSAVVHALNGDIVVGFAEIAPGKPMSFSSMNGKMDVTFPPSLKANVVIRTDNGEIWSDFDIKLEARNQQPAVEDTRGKGGRYSIKLDKAVYGTINGGGPEIQFKGFNGSIYIRKSAK